MNKKLITIMIIIAVVAGGAAGAIAAILLTEGEYGAQTTVAVTVTGTTSDRGDADDVVCTQEARQCADGSYVGRVPPECDFAPCPELPPAQQAENIRVYAPAPGADISSPVPISGEARVFEGTVNYRVRDNNDNIIGEGFTTAASPEMGQFGPFSVVAGFSSPETEIGTVEVFNLSPRDGSVENLVVMRVRFSSST